LLRKGAINCTFANVGRVFPDISRGISALKQRKPALRPLGERDTGFIRLQLSDDKLAVWVFNGSDLMDFRKKLHILSSCHSVFAKNDSLLQNAAR
jgi:hypothetical protein